MDEQYQMGMSVTKLLKKLGVHPVTIAEATSDDNYKKSYQLITSNPKISKEEFLKEMEIEEFED